MFDLHKDLNDFYNDYVRLGNERAILADHRDKNLERLKKGLDNLEFASCFSHMDQGSYAMYTINKQVNKDYDLDEAIIFTRDDLPSSALDTRLRIEKAMREGGGNFSQPPQALTNAIRVYYTEGHHIDLAIYRKYENNYGEIIYEHAGSDWSTRNPADLTNWFNDIVNQLSPSKDNGASVENGQMRRVVRWIKKFAKSRENWNLPCGLVISVLVSECYRSNYNRDDISLYDTLVAIRNRLIINEEVLNPVDINQTLTNRQKDKTRVHNFREKLETAVENLQILHASTCTEEQARSAWYWFFQHEFWSTNDQARSFDEQGKSLATAALSGSIFVSPNGNIYTEKPIGKSLPVPKQNFYGE